MLRKIVIGVVAVVVLLALALVAFVALFDANRYKPQIENAARQQLGRTLRIDGDLSLSLFPNLALAVPKVTLSERGSERTFASLERARVSVALLPLLRGKVQADTITLAGLRAAIVRRADGSTSIDDLTGAGKAKAAPQAGPPPGGGAPPALATLELGGVDVADAGVSIHDERDGSTMTLSHLNVKIGRIAPNAATPVEVSAALDVSQPPAHVDLKLAADGVAHEGSQAKVGKLAVDLSARQAEQAVALSLSGPASADLAALRFELPKLEGELRADLPSLPQKTLKVALASALVVDAKAQHVRANADARFDDSVAALKLDLDGFSAPRIAFDATVDRIDLDRYLKPAPAAAPASPGTNPAETPAATAAADPKVDLSALKPLNLNGRVTVGSLKAFGLKAAKLQAVIKAAAGRLDVAPLSATLYEGTLNAAARAEENTNRVTANVTLAGISIGPLLSDATGKEPIDGHGSIDFDLTTQGATVGAMRHALGGTAGVALRDGAIHGINVAQRLRDLRAAVQSGSLQTQAASGAEKTDFSELSAHFVVRNGVATNNDLQLASPLLRATGAGSIDVGALTLDYTAKVSVVGTLAGQDGQPISDLNGITVPLHVSGPFSQLAFGLDWRDAARQTVAKKATEQLKARLGTGGKPADLLKGLLGR